MPTQQEQEDALFQHLRDSGYSEEEASMAAAEAMGTSDQGMPGAELYSNPGGSAAKALIPLAGTLGGGIGARVLAGKLIPKTAAVIGPLISGAGQATGAFAGNKAIGMPTQQAFENAMMAGGIGGAVEGFGNLITRGGAWVGGVPRATVNETLKSPARAWELGRPFNIPPPEAEFNMAKDMQARLQTETPAPGTTSLGKKTVARQRAETSIRRFDRSKLAQETPEGQTPHPLSPDAYLESKTSGWQDYEKSYPANIDALESKRRAEIVSAMNRGEKLPAEVFSGNQDLLHAQEATIPTDPIKNRIISMIKPNSLEEGQRTVNNYLQSKADSLPKRMTASELDQFILEHKKPIQNTFGQDQVSLPQSVKKNIVGAAIQTRNAAIPEAKADFAKASKQLSAMKAMSRKLLVQTGPDAGKVKPTAEGAFKNILQNQSTREMFRTYEEQTGNTGILKKADDLAMKRQWSREDFGHAGYLWYLAERLFGRPAGKVAAIVAQPAGHTAAAITAFSNAMNPQEQPNP